MNIFKIALCIIILVIAGCANELTEQAPPKKADEANLSQTAADEVSYEVTFIELGSKNCVPCKMMQPVMDNIEKDYAGKVKVVFYDVWTAEGRPYGQKYGVQAIPTQVFLDKSGEEFFRHTGFLPEKEVIKVLESQGVTKE
jgi:thioredoxin 1